MLFRMLPEKVPEPLLAPTVRVRLPLFAKMIPLPFSPPIVALCSHRSIRPESVMVDPPMWRSPVPLTSRAVVVPPAEAMVVGPV